MITPPAALARAYALADAHANAYEDHMNALVAPVLDDPECDRLARIAVDASRALGLTGRCGADAPDVLLWRTVAELPPKALATVIDGDDESARGAIAHAIVAMIGVEMYDRAMLTTDYELCHLYLSTTGC